MPVKRPTSRSLADFDARRFITRLAEKGSGRLLGAQTFTKDVKQLSCCAG